VRLLALVVGSRKRCAGSCQVHTLSAAWPAHRHDMSSTKQYDNLPELDNEELP
jgi:hypothetical protein